MRTLELHYCKERGTCVGCLGMLIPKYAVSSRDECVVLGVILPVIGLHYHLPQHVRTI